MDAARRVLNVATTVVLGCGLVAWLVQPARLRADLVLTAGLLLLMTMPVAQLVGAVIEELRAREWRFAIVGAVVLLLLGGSVLISLRWL